MSVDPRRAFGRMSTSSSISQRRLRLPVWRRFARSYGFPTSWPRPALTEADERALEAPESHRVPSIAAANFSVGVSLALELVETYSAAARTRLRYRDHGAPSRQETRCAERNSDRTRCGGRLADEASSRPCWAAPAYSAVRAGLTKSASPRCAWRRRPESTPSSFSVLW